MRSISTFISNHKGFWARAGVLWVLLAVSPAAAQPLEEPVAAVPATEKLNPASPRAAVIGFLTAAHEGDWEEAATFLNLDPVAPGQRETLGPDLARDLKVVLDQTLWVEVDLLSNQPEGARDDGLPASRDRVGTLKSATGPVDILVDRVRGADGSFAWKISAATVSRIPELTEEFGYGVLGDVLPPVFFGTFGLEIQLWQWIGLLGIAVLAWAVSWMVARGVLRLLQKAVSQSETDIDDALVEAISGPLRLGAGLVIFSIGSVALGLSLPAQRMLFGVEKATGIIAVTWLILRLIDVFSTAVERHLMQRDQTSATSFVPLGRKTIKAFVAILAGLAALDSFGFDVTALIAGLGIGGLAIALALQKTLENLFGGATLIADRPLRVGDFCRFGDRVGTVEEIGMRSTRVRTLDRTVVTVPNAEFSTMQLENFAARDKIWYHPRLGLRYETTPDQLRYVLVELRRMLYSHPKVDPDPARVRFVNFGDFSLDLDLYAYIRAADYSEYLEVAEDLNLRIIDIVGKAGTGFAFPSNTTYIARDDGVNAERAREATEAVAGWRERNELFLPGFPPEKISELGGSLPWPPEGSALGTKRADTHGAEPKS